MSDVVWKYNPKNPANQPFNIKGRKNLTKAKGWWTRGHNNPVKSKKKQED